MKIKPLLILLISLLLCFLTGCTGKTEITTGASLEESLEKIDCKDNMTCFDSRFASCLPATVTSHPVQTISYAYEILRPQEDRCVIKATFTKHHHPDWEGKEMTCYSHNKLGVTFDEAWWLALKGLYSGKNFENCQGSMYDTLVEKSKEYKTVLI